MTAMNETCWRVSICNRNPDVALTVLISRRRRPAGLASLQVTVAYVCYSTEGLAPSHTNR